MTTEICACGRPLHYSDPKIRAAVERLIDELGPNIVVEIDGRRWSVQRHYIALHGLDATTVKNFPEAPP